MAYTALPTKNPGDLLTSALWNTYLQGNADNGFMRMIRDTTLGSNQASVTFASIPQTFAHLLAVVVARTDSGVVGGDYVGLQVNGDTGGNYDALQPDGITSQGQSQAKCAIAVGGGSTANLFATNFILIPYYRGTTSRKTFICFNGGHYANVGVDYVGGNTGIGEWRTNATAITQLLFTAISNQFVTDSRFTLYGLPQ